MFVHDRISGLTTRVSVAKSGEEVDGNAEAELARARGGRQDVPIESRAKNLVADDTFNGTSRG